MERVYGEPKTQAVTCSCGTGDRSLTFRYRNLGNFRGFYTAETISRIKSRFEMGTLLALPVIDGRLSAKSKDVTADSSSVENNPKMAVWGIITPSRENFQNSSIKAQ